MIHILKRFFLTDMQIYCYTSSACMINTFFKSNHKLMLIEPPFYRLYHDQYCLVKYPLALGYLSGSVIKNTNWDVQTYNADFNAEKKVFVPENDYITGKGFERYLSSIKDSSLPMSSMIIERSIIGTTKFRKVKIYYEKFSRSECLI